MSGKPLFFMSFLAGTVVVMCGIFLIGFAVVAFAAPASAKRFLLAFASSARTHYTEQGFRLLFGASLVLFSPAMWQASIFQLVGWAIFVSSLILVLLPWRWHQRLGERVLPMVVRYLRPYALGSLAFGALLLYGVFASRYHG